VSQDGKQVERVACRDAGSVGYRRCCVYVIVERTMPTEHKRHRSPSPVTYRRRLLQYHILPGLPVILVNVYVWHSINYKLYIYSKISIRIRAPVRPFLTWTPSTSTVLVLWCP